MATNDKPYCGEFATRGSSYGGCGLASNPADWGDDLQEVVDQMASKLCERDL
ncbi:hypothetical protein F383_09838 [Gossypium arboreum]|uniref:Uncharacterized protein n=1 Tax=Gossypium arboreum TaxID=29729 RepID=A0A0B0P5D7_GOSAR|nr:hypothetical protein F383_09838 [Gossypium arboreum]